MRAAAWWVRQPLLRRRGHEPHRRWWQHSRCPRCFCAPVATAAAAAHTARGSTLSRRNRRIATELGAANDGADARAGCCHVRQAGRRRRVLGERGSSRGGLGSRGDGWRVAGRGLGATNRPATRPAFPRRPRSLRTGPAAGVAAAAAAAAARANGFGTSSEAAGTSGTGGLCACIRARGGSDSPEQRVVPSKP